MAVGDKRGTGAGAHDLEDTHDGHCERSDHEAEVMASDPCASAAAVVVAVAG